MPSSVQKSPFSCSASQAANRPVSGNPATPPSATTAECASPERQPPRRNVAVVAAISTMCFLPRGLQKIPDNTGSVSSLYQPNSTSHESPRNRASVADTPANLRLNQPVPSMLSFLSHRLKHKGSEFSTQCILRFERQQFAQSPEREFEQIASVVLLVA